MRVLHVVSTCERRGGETFASDLTRALCEMGIDQQVVILRCSENTDLRFEAPVVFAGAEGTSLPGRINARTLVSLRALLRADRPHIVQVHGGEPLKYAVAANVGLHIPLVYRRIGATPQWMAGRIRRYAYAALMRRASKVIAVGEAVRRETIQRFRVNEARVVTIPNAIDTRRMRSTLDRSAMRRILGVPRNAPLAIWVGALTREKDPIAAIELAQRVARRRPTFILALVGEGTLRGSVEHKLQGLGADPPVRILGVRGDVPELLAASDVLVSTSRTEGMPACVIEAGVMGLPVVSYTVGGVGELILEGRTGMLAPAEDLDGLADRLVQLLDDPVRSKQIGQSARTWCISNFDIRSVAPRYVDVYRQLASSATVPHSAVRNARTRSDCQAGG